MSKPTDDIPHPLQAEAWRRMGASARSEMGVALRQKVREWKTSALRAQHPEWTEVRLGREVAAIYLRGNI